MNMIERVGRALAEQERYTYDPEPYDARARAAIEAMREPTESMKVAGGIDPGSGGPDEGYETEVWQAMINAALSEKP